MMSHLARGSRGPQPSAGSAVPSASEWQDAACTQHPGCTQHPRPALQGPVVAQGQKTTVQGSGQHRGDAWQDRRKPGCPHKANTGRRFNPCQHQHHRVGTQTRDPTLCSALKTPRNPCKAQHRPMSPKPSAAYWGEKAAGFTLSKSINTAQALQDKQSHRPQHRWSSPAPCSSARS